MSSFIAAGGVWTYLGYVARYAFWEPAAAVTVWNALEWTPSALPLRPWQKALAWGVLALGSHTARASTWDGRSPRFSSCPL